MVWSEIGINKVSCNVLVDNNNYNLFIVYNNQLASIH